MHCLRLFSAYLQHIHLVSKMLVILFLNHVYNTSHLDIVYYPLVTLCGMIVTLLDSSVSFFFFLVDGVPMFVFATRVH